MPRILKADLFRLYESQTDLNKVVLAENLRLRAELVKVRKERERSRSPRRPTMSEADKHSVWKLVCHTDRDAVILEQRATNARLHTEIASLKRGEGLMGPILMAKWEALGVMNDGVKEQIARWGTMTVINYMKRLDHLNSHITDVLRWGGCIWDRYTEHSSFAGARVRNTGA